ncbi:chemotaxis protein CheD [Salipaludibacillus aurantiacus]|uniref:Probable chemoreceptor glutamine deamidase CheD n=1 Tax=Salipaludibacillus aurantiacus TaxID=1601833 RepID=A0A1H9QIR1_9BACI|nr:chemotaxis protein CheD [Salipaludibacillus aurantiacus]SER60075.1 chemotaxis protein CheD [Salipaludibacillus aurantiacus]
MNNLIKVGMAELKVAKSPQIIRTSGLGSCVGIILYNEKAKVSGLAHIMLPDSSCARAGVLNRAKYADTAINDLVQLLGIEGVPSCLLKAKIAGGAQMFKFSSKNESMRIGPRNVEAVKEILYRLNIPVLFEDVGGNMGRTIQFNPATSILEIRTVSKGLVQV